MAVRIFHKDYPDLKMPMIAADARLVVWLGTGSKTANMNYVDMQPGERNNIFLKEYQLIKFLKNDP